MSAVSGRFAITPARAVEDHRLGDAAYRVLALLGTYSDRDGWCWPSMPTLAKRLDVTRQAVQQRINQLAKCGYIEVQPQNRTDGGQAANHYRLLFDRALFQVQNDLAEDEAGEQSPPQDQLAPPQDQLAGPAMSPCGPRKIDAISPIPPYKEERTHKNVSKSANEDHFAQFWRVYPSRGPHAHSKKAARERFLAAVKRGVDPELMFRAAANYAECMRRTGTTGRWVKTAEAWLNNEMWEQYGNDPDDLAPPRQAGMI